MNELLNKISNEIKNPIILRGSVAFSILNNNDFKDKSDLDILIPTHSAFLELIESLNKIFSKVSEGNYIYINSNLPRKKIEIENNGKEYSIDALIVENYFMETKAITDYSDKIHLPSSNDLISSLIIALSSNEIGIDLKANFSKTERFYKRLINLVDKADIEKTVISLKNQIKFQNVFYSTEYFFEEILYYFYKNYQVQKKLNPQLESSNLFDLVSSICSYHLRNSNKDIIEFYKSNEEFGCFSNFSLYKVIYENEEWQTAEHCYQANKFTNALHRNSIKNQQTPKESAIIGRSRAELLRKDWDFVRIIKMYNIVKNKVSQNPIVYITLLSTKDKPIYEVSPKDEFWGLGKNGNGKNILGQIFCSIRNDIF
jgi:hypothetical protein